MPLTKEEIGQIAERTADEVMERMGQEREERRLRDYIIGSAIGEGAIPLYGRETRKEPCSCCLIDPKGPNEPENRMCTSSGCIGILKDSEEREWCSEINLVPDGRCERVMRIKEAAKECREKYPEDTEAFFKCYAPAWASITGSSSHHSDSIPRSAIPEPYATEIRKELRKMPTWELREAYDKLKVGEPTGLELLERDRAYAISAIGEVLWERGKLPQGQK